MMRRGMRVAGVRWTFCRIDVAALVAAGLLALAIPLSCWWVPVLEHEREGGGNYTDWMIANGVMIYERVDTRSALPYPIDREWAFTLRKMDSRTVREFAGYFKWRTLGFGWF